MKSQRHKIHPGDCKGHEALSPENQTPKYLCKKRKLFRVGSVRILFRSLRDHQNFRAYFVIFYDLNGEGTVVPGEGTVVPMDGILKGA